MEFFKDIIYDIEAVCFDARNDITKLGFPKMHVNVVIDDLTDDEDTSGAAGLAFGNRNPNQKRGEKGQSQSHQKGTTSRKYIKINLRNLLKFDDFTRKIS